MPTSEITRSHLVRSLVDLGTLLTGPESFDDRMTGLCTAAADLLQCDQFTLVTIDHEVYRGAFHYGLPAGLASQFHRYVVPRDKPIIAAIEACDTYLLVNNATTDAALSKIATIVGVASVIIVPFTHPDGRPLGYATAGYTTEKLEVTHNEAELALGVARFAQTTVLRDLESQRRREVSQAMLEVADSERRRLSRDIHDDPLQRILALRIGLEAFRTRLGSQPAANELDDLVNQCRQASASLREVMLRTHPRASELADLSEVLHALVAQDAFGASVNLTFTDERTELSPRYLVPTLNRIGEQAARNTLHHANARNLTVAVKEHNGGTLLTICDDGDGFDPSTVDRTHLGLISMRERTELLDGCFTLTTAPGRGTYISAWFPHAEGN